MSNLYFQYCQKLIIFEEGFKKVLLAKRKGEQDYDGIFSFIGGKMETTDGGFIESMRREKNEEIGEAAKVSVALVPVFSTLFTKKDGSAMILPHYVAKYTEGDIKINDEYSEYQWVAVDDLNGFSPKIDTIEPAVLQAVRFVEFFTDKDFIEL